MTKTRKIFSAEFKLESAQLVVDQCYFIITVQAYHHDKNTCHKLELEWSPLTEVIERPLMGSPER